MFNNKETNNLLNNFLYESQEGIEPLIYRLCRSTTGPSVNLTLLTFKYGHCEIRTHDFYQVLVFKTSAINQTRPSTLNLKRDISNSSSLPQVY